MIRRGLRHQEQKLELVQDQGTNQRVAEAIMEMAGEQGEDGQREPPDKFYNPGSHISLSCLIRLSPPPTRSDLMQEEADQERHSSGYHQCDLEEGRRGAGPAESRTNKVCPPPMYFFAKTTTRQHGGAGGGGPSGEQPPHQPGGGGGRGAVLLLIANL